MTRMAMVALAGILLLDLPVFSKTADQLKSELAALMPQGKKLRCAWGQGGAVYVVDSDDGAVRKLTTGTVSGNISVPLITRDGQRIVFQEDNSARVYVVNWDGTNVKQITNCGCPGAVWQDPADNSQWVMASVDGSTLINLDNFTQRRKIWTDGMCIVGDGDGCGISIDGKRIGGFLCEIGFWASGIAPTPGGTPVCNTHGGCNFAMRPTVGAYEYCHFNSGHGSICIHNADGSVKDASADMTSTVSAAGQKGGESSDLQWTSHPDYVMYRNGNRYNPILFQLSTKKFVAIRDDASSVTGRPDGVFMPTSTVAVHPRGSAGARFPLRTGENSLYTLAGRRCASVPGSGLADAGVNGVAIYSHDGRVSKTAILHTR